VALAAIEAGKSVYNEKPLAVTREEGQRILAAAEAKGVRVSGAPDTFLGAGGQTCRKLIDDGVIGRPTAVTAYMMGRGHETWHPDPDFYYQPGGGPMFDMGPYYLTALINLLGPVKRLTGATKITFPERTITSEPKHGTIIQVNTPTHIAGLMDFESGVLGTIITSFDVYAAQVPCIQIFGTEGTLNVPDPNGFGGPVKYWRPDADGWVEVPIERPYAENSRCVGVADMARAIHSGRPHRANGRMAYHVLDVMHGFLDASEQGKHIALDSTCDRPAPLPEGLAEGELD
jgi:predicted dehydrogenase